MRKAIPIRLLILITVLFMAIAAVSFAAFTAREQSCTGMVDCRPAKRTGEMLWDRFSNHFFSLAK